MRPLLLGQLLLSLACSRADTRDADSARGASDHADSVTPAGAPAVRESSSGADASGQASCLVTDSSMGPVRIGMTLADARQAMPGATFTRGFDGDGVASVDVVKGADNIMSLVADADEDETIDWSKRIVFIETFSPTCRTADGVHPGALVRDVERILGPITRVILSEIESRQFITFARQPEGITFRLDYSGIFDEGSRETRRVEPEGKIFSIAIADR